MREEPEVVMLIRHSIMSRAMKKYGMMKTHPRKIGYHSGATYERFYSNSMWHTNYKKLDDGRWLIVYQDDASEFITGWGTFENATSENAILVLEKAIEKYGKPATILTDHGSQFYASKSKTRRDGASKYEMKLVELDIRHVLATLKHPQTNGKLELFYMELHDRPYHFRDVAGIPEAATPIEADAMESDPVGRVIKYYNYYRLHMSLDRDKRETPHQSFIKKMPPKEDVVEV